MGFVALIWEPRMIRGGTRRKRIPINSPMPMGTRAAMAETQRPTGMK
jgi:hypothetical protein